MDGFATAVPASPLRLLERTDELRVLAGALRAVREDRHGRLVLIRGEEGIGKTAVVRRFCDEQRPPARVLWGACEALFTPRALGPFVEIAESVDGEFRDLVERGGRPHEVASALAVEVARASPTVLVLEDLHWADEATLDVLRLLGRRIDAVPALVVTTYRDDELDGSHPLRVVLGELARAGGVDRVEIPRLSRDAVAELAGANGIDADTLHRATAGNPFFVTEVLGAGTTHVPSTVRDAVLARTSRLSGSARALLEAIAIAPPEADLDVLEAIAAGSLESLEECIDGGMVVPAACGVAFRHELGRLVVEDSIPPHRRMTLNARALAALEGSGDSARLAHHADAAGDADAVLRFAPEAARRAAALGAHRESAAQYARALRFAERLGPEERADLLERRSYECMLTDQIDAAIDALEAAIAIRRALGDVRAEGQALEQLANVLWCPGRVAEARQATLQAVALLEGIPRGRELAMAYGRMAQLCMDAEDAGQAVAWATRALELSDELGETQIGVHAMNSMATARLLSDDAAAEGELERSLARAVDAGLEDDVARAMAHLGWTAQRRRSYQLALDVLDRGLRLASDRGWELRRAYLLAYLARVQFDLGRWTDAVASVQPVLSEPRRSRVPRIIALTILGRVRARRGEPEVWPLLDEALSLARRGEELQAEIPVAVARAEASWLEGDREGVERATAPALALARRRRARDATAELVSWRSRAGILDRLRDDETAEPYALEIAGDWPAAVAAWQELGCPYEAALALSELDGEEGPRRAIDGLRALGAARSEATVARRLRERGTRLPRGPRRQTRANPSGLTARELEVLSLLAGGLRDAEIARRLVLSERTVNHHVSAILRKLDVQSRGEASAEAWRLGLAPAG